MPNQISNFVFKIGSLQILQSTSIFPSYFVQYTKRTDTLKIKLTDFNLLHNSCPCACLYNKTFLRKPVNLDLWTVLKWIKTKHISEYSLRVPLSSEIF